MNWRRLIDAPGVKQLRRAVWNTVLAVTKGKIEDRLDKTKKELPDGNSKS